MSKDLLLNCIGGRSSILKFLEYPNEVKNFYRRHTCELGSN